MLFYKSYLPSPDLSSLVARYMIISDNKVHREWQQLEVTPHGLSGLGFSFGENLWYHHTSPEKRRKIFPGNMAGLHDCTYTLSWKLPINFLVIVFKPGGVFRFLKTDMGCLKNSLYNLNFLGVTESEEICDNLRRLPAHKSRIAFIEAWLGKKLRGKTWAPGITEAIAQKIVERKGNVLIKDLCSEFEINRKYLERHFHLELGSGPKEFAGLVRFSYLNTLLRQRMLSWKELVYLGNFHDQSHLIKHFHRITGLAPGEFIKTADHGPLSSFVNKHNVHELILANTVIPGILP